MSDTTIQATDAVPDPLVMFPCRVYVCDISGEPHVRHVAGDVYVHSWNRTAGEPSGWVPSIRENFLRVWNAHNAEYVTVHPSSMDSACSWCGEPVHTEFIDSDDYERMGRTDEILCASCVGGASICAHWRCRIFLHDDNVYSLNDDSYCESCYYDVSESCEYCDERYHVDDEPQCGCSSRFIQPYSNKFMPLRMHTVSDSGELLTTQQRHLSRRDVNGIYLGLEFEMENMGRSYDTNEIAQLFEEPIGTEQLMLKHDGSINDGFELVSQPHSLDAFMKFFPWDLITEAQSHGMRGWDVGHREIGIHIHINRKAFYTSPDHNRYNASPHLLGFMNFIYRNVPSIKRIAGRNVHYGHMSEAYLDEAYGICREGRSQRTRTLGINVQNDTTVELRMFRSTMRVERVQAYLQFAEAAVRYTQTDRVSKMRDRFNFRQFATWCSFQDRYKQLNELIAETDAVSFAPAIDRNRDLVLVDTHGDFVSSNSDIDN